MPAPTKTPTKTAPKTAPPRPRRRTAEQVGLAAAVAIVIGLLGLGALSLVASPTPSASAETSPGARVDPGEGTPAPGESDAPISAVLEARMPATIDGVTLTIQSAVDATSLSSSPDGRALNAAVVHHGKEATDLEIAVAYDETGSLDLAILAFRVDGIAVADLRAAVLSAWLAAETPGVTQTSLTWSGTAVTKVSYGDEGADEYVITIDDGVYVLETADAALAESAVGLLVGSEDAPAS